MTGEEMERAIEFLLQGQAHADARIAALAERQDQTDQQIAEMGKQVAEMSLHIQTYADTQSQFIEIVTRTLEGLAASQERMDRKLAESNARTEQRISEATARIAETNARLAETNARTEQRIVETNERTEQLRAEMNARTEQLMTEARTRGAEIDARLDRLAALVERNISGGSDNS